MDIEQTTEQQLLGHAERQTDALESLRGIALVWMAIVGIAVIVWVASVLH